LGISAEEGCSGQRRDAACKRRIGRAIDIDRELRPVGDDGEVVPAIGRDRRARAGGALRTTPAVPAAPVTSMKGAPLSRPITSALAPSRRL
jgi:hypothetical protein